MNYAPFDWVIAAHQPTSSQGKYILELANIGVGYHLLNKNRLKTDNILVGFKFVANKPLPSHLQYATADQSHKLDELDRKRKEP